MKKLNVVSIAATMIVLILQNVLSANSPVLKFTGAGPNSFFGISTKNAGDVNNDGFEDVIIGASYNPNINPIGKAFIYFGGIIMDTIPDVIFQNQTPNDNFGFCVDGAGDVNGDGFDDVIIGAGLYVSASGYGRAYIFFGGASMDNIPDVTIQGAPGDGYLAYFVSNAGDVNGDGFSDVIVNGSHNDYGRVFLYFGGASMDSIPDITFEGELQTDHFSFGELSKLGDVNNDGFDDVFIASVNYPCYSCPSRGKVYLYYGGMSMDNVADLTIMGENTGQNYFGASKEGGDINGDGFVDLIVSDPNWGIYGTGNIGRLYVFYGGVSMDTIPDKIIRGQFDDDNFGANVTSSDLNNDGFDDIIVGASKFQYPVYQGKVYVYLGGANMDTTADITHVGESDSSEYGEQVAAVDIDGDGYKEYLVGASRYSGTVGRSYLYHLPDILKVTPSQNAINVTKSSDIQVTFSKEMNASTVNSSNIKVFGFQTGLKSAAVSYNAGTRTATINPSSDFKVGEKIQVTLSSGIKTSSNIPITPFIWTFTVQASGGTGIFTEIQNILPGLDIIHNLLPGDFDNDGDLDLCAINFHFGFYIKVFKNDGSGNYNTTAISLNISPYANTYISSLAADYDNDGDLDIALTAQNNDIIIFKNNSNGAFSYSSTAPGLGAALFKQGDFDNDGDIDLVSYKDEIGASLGNTIVSVNDGSGNFIFRSQAYSSCGCPIEGDHISSALLVNDFDNDGDLDIAIEGKQLDGVADHSNCECSYFDIFKNAGDGTFAGVSSVNALNYFGNAVSDDINGDGYNDLITNSNDIYSNNNLIFTHSTFPGAGGNLLTGDFDGDGDLDLSENIQNSNLVKFYKNNSLGNFSDLSFNSVNQYNKYFESGDVDNDGDIDVLVVYSSGQVSALRNNYSCTPAFCSITGDSIVPIGSLNNLYIGSTNNGYWDITNYDTTQASIVPNPGGDSVLVNAGPVPGHFTLFFITPDSCGGLPFCEKHVYVEGNGVCQITGNETILPGSLNNVFLSNSSAGYWEISNYDNTQASIQINTTGDSARISAGLIAGHFILFKIIPDGHGGYPFCEKHVYVEDSNAINCNITAILEGEFNLASGKLNMRDTITAFLRNIQAPYAIVDSANAVVDSLIFTAGFRFYNAPAGSYYIVLKHRNGIETWSKSGGEVFTRGTALSYDFSSAQSQAYGNNLKLKGTKYCIFSGDVNHDEIIDLADLILIYNDASSFAAGYLITDLTGDKLADLSDMTIAYNNSVNFIQLMRP